MGPLGDTATPLEVDGFAREMAYQLYLEVCAPTGPGGLPVKLGAMPTVCQDTLTTLETSVQAEVYAALAESTMAKIRGKLRKSQFRPTAADQNRPGAQLMATVLSYTFVKDLEGIEVALTQASELDRRQSAQDLCRFLQAFNSGRVTWG